MVEQAGVIAWRRGVFGCEVLLVTSRTSGRWVVPKGMVEAHLGSVDSAAEEAWEEGGVRGEVHPVAVGHYHYEKWGQQLRVTLYPMRVTEVLDDWPEADERERIWVPLRDAAGRVREPELVQVLAQLAEDPDFGAPTLPALRISWLPSQILTGPARLGVCSIPGEQADARDRDLRDLRAAGVTHLVCFVEGHELASLQPSETPEQRADAVRDAGMAFLHVPVEDFRAPTLAQVEETMRWLSTALQQGGSVVLHCWAGLGRAGTMLACALVSRGMNAHDAIVTTRWVRPGAIQSQGQETRVAEYARSRKT
ncbi:MAG: dual specificity protein phosphatase family protein [Myxococcales bacterium]|nr:dual specificity protein phosphatase family protein [Myxococcales bacterium]